MLSVPLPVSIAIVQGSCISAAVATGRHLHADPLALLAVVLQCPLPAGLAAGRQDEQRREGAFLTVPRKQGAPTVPNACARSVSEGLPVSRFPGQVSGVGACCCGAMAVVTATLQALTAEAAPK